MMINAYEYWAGDTVWRNNRSRTHRASDRENKNTFFALNFLNRFPMSFATVIQSVIFFCALKCIKRGSGLS
jgi:hypothetical protein